MEISVHDTSLNRIGIVDQYESLVWTRRYSSAGEFALLAPFTLHNAALLQVGNIIRKPGDAEAGQITYQYLHKDLQGKEVIEVKGAFVTAWLGQRVINGQIETADRPELIIDRIVNENAANPTDAPRKLPILKPAPPFNTGQAVEYVSGEFANVLGAVEELAAAFETGINITADAVAKTYTFNQYRGIDRSIEQSVVPRVVFSNDFDNVKEQTYEYSNDNYRTTIYVVGESLPRPEWPPFQSDTGATGEIPYTTLLQRYNAAMVEYQANQPPGFIIGAGAELARRELSVLVTDIKRPVRPDINDPYYNTSMTVYSQELTRWNAAMVARGVTELADCIEAESFESTIDPLNTFVYKEDFDIGDIVTCVNKRWNIQLNARITEATETYQQSGNEVIITFGDALPTLYQKLRA
jgi:hypothetical protein